MKKLFLLLALFSLLCVGCSEPNDPIDTPQDPTEQPGNDTGNGDEGNEDENGGNNDENEGNEDENKTFITDAKGNIIVEAEGGEGVITFTAEWKDVTRNSPVPEPEVEATCEAQWVENLTVAENITFTVLANEADARETKVVVTYGEQKVRVSVKQAAKSSNNEERHF